VKTIVLTRIDDRLIHGQVVTAWVKHTKGNRIIIADDTLVNDSFMQQVLKMAAPSGIKVDVFSKEDTVKDLKESSKNDEKIIILIKVPQVIEYLVDNGVEIRTLILGGMGARIGRRRFHKNISVDDAELECFKRLSDKGVQVLVQIVPDERAIDIKKLV